MMLTEPEDRKAVAMSLDILNDCLAPDEFSETAEASVFRMADDSPEELVRELGKARDALAVILRNHSLRALALVEEQSGAAPAHSPAQ